jgi:hypothetical protein
MNPLSTKRTQFPSIRNFGRDHRYPITNKFREEIATPPLKGSLRAASVGEAPRTARPRVDAAEVA